MWGVHLLRPAPALREVHFWCLNPEDVQSPALLRAYDHFLCADERKHLYAVQAEEQKDRLLARTLMRTTLARYSNGLHTPSSLKFRKNEFGKPELSHQDNKLDLRFNLSHTNSLIACGVTVSSQIGIDVEDKGRAFRGDFMKLARRRFSVQEVSWLETFSSDDERRHRFLQLWTLKEAYVKALGKGIGGEPLKNFTFELGECFEEGTHHQKISLSHPDSEGSAKWRFLLFEPSSRHFASICIQKLDNIPQVFKFWKTVPLVSDEPLTTVSALAWTDDDVQEAGKEVSILS